MDTTGKAVWTAPPAFERIEDLARVESCRDCEGIMQAGGLCEDCHDALDECMRALGAEPCRAEMPWDRKHCPNLADGPDGFCEQCRDELGELERWAELEATRFDGLRVPRW